MSSIGSWSAWRPFPDPRKGGTYRAPEGPGVYELRHISNGEYIRVGESKTVAKRMKSLLPAPYGSGTRNNTQVRDYVLLHVADIEYRTLACASKEEAKGIQDSLLATGKYIFNT